MISYVSNGLLSILGKVGGKNRNLSIYLMENIFKRKQPFNLSEDGETGTTYFPSSFESLSVSEDQMIHFAAYNSGMH